MTDKKFEMTNKKYILTNQAFKIDGRPLYRIKAIRDFEDVKAGDLGGFIEKEDNLSHDGDAWVCGDALVYDNAQVYGNAQVCGNARVCGSAWVYGNARVCGDARVYGYARVCGDALVYGNANILWASKIGSRFGTTTVFENKDGGISVSCGCFFGTLEEFEKKVEEMHGNNKYGREYKVLIELIKIHFGLEKITDEK